MMVSRSYLSLMLACIGGLNSIWALSAMGAGGNPGSLFFSLGTTRYFHQGEDNAEAGGGLSENLIEGQILVQQSDPNAMRLEFRIERIRPVGDGPLPSELKERFAQFTKYVPFVGRVSMSAQDDGPIGIRLVKGAADPNDASGLGRQILASQYQMIYTILDMMMFATRNKEEVASASERQWTVTPTERSEVQTDRLGALALSDMRSFLCPSHFCVVPVIEGKTIRGLQFTSFDCCDRVVKYHSRVLDSRIGFVVHSMSLEATTKARIAGDSFGEMASLMNDLARFRSYGMYELTISDKPASGN